MDTTLDATPRETARGKSGARKVRKAGSLPAVIYGRDAKATSVTVDPVALQAIFRTTKDRNTVVRLQLEGATVPCLVRKVQHHPLSRALVHVDFYRLDEGQEVTVDVPLETVGKPRGATVGGRLRTIVREVPVRCRWDRIPAKIVADVSPLGVGEFIKISQLPAPEGVSFAFEHDYNVVTIEGKRLGEEEPAAAAPAAAEAEAESEDE